MDNISECQAKSRQDGAVAIQHNLVDAKITSNAACVLTTSTTKHSQRVIAGIMSFGFSQGTDGAAHGLVGYLDEAIHNLIQGLVLASRGIDGVCKLLELFLHNIPVQRLVFVGPKNLGKVVWQKTTEIQVGI